jgi:hypothetical protein
MLRIASTTITNLRLAQSFLRLSPRCFGPHLFGCEHQFGLSSHQPLRNHVMIMNHVSHSTSSWAVMHSDGIAAFSENYGLDFSLPTLQNECAVFCLLTNVSFTLLRNEIKMTFMATRSWHYLQEPMNLRCHLFDDIPYQLSFLFLCQFARVQF